MADLRKKFPADAAPDDLASKNFQLYELTKSELFSQLAPALLGWLYLTERRISKHYDP